MTMASERRRPESEFKQKEGLLENKTHPPPYMPKNASKETSVILDTGSLPYK
jgi:hypothetical protein